MESIPQQESRSHFIFPSLEHEKGEIERVATLFEPRDVMNFKKKFFEAYQTATLTPLSEELWSKLENTDSFDIPRGDFSAVDGHVDYYNTNTGSNRDWTDLKEKMTSGTPIDAPMIVNYNGTLHLVSGNTRLMTARALGITPEVLIVEI